MEEMFKTGSPAVDKMSRLRITGNIIPMSWFQTILKATGKPNLNAIIILADIVYWYRPVEVRDEMTGQLIGLKKRFRSDLLQRSYQQMADQFGFTKRDATNAVVELEKLGVIKRVFRTIERGGHLVSNVLFLELHVDILEQLTYPENFGGEGKPHGGYPRFEGEVSPKSETGISDTGYTVSPESVRDATQNCETNTDTTNIDYNKDFRFVSFETVKERIRNQIDYEVLKFDYPYDKRIEEIVGIMADVMTSTAQVIRVNKEDKPASIVKAQFAKLRKEHVEYVMDRMDETQTKARNIRAVLITALYNSVHTMSSYYGNLYQYHQSLD